MHLGNKTSNPLYSPLTSQLYPVYLLTLTYSNGHSSIALVIPEQTPPNMILYYIPNPGTV